jgi:hypothetical protein
MQRNGKQRCKPTSSSGAWRHGRLRHCLTALTVAALCATGPPVYAAVGIVADLASGSGCLASNPHNCGNTGNSSSISVNYTVSGGANNFIVVGVAAGNSVASVTYRGVVLPAISAVAGSSLCVVQLFGGVPAASGPNTAAATGSGAMSIMAFSFVNVNASSLGNTSTATGSATPMAVPVTTTQAQVVVDYGCMFTLGSPVITVTNNATTVNIVRHAVTSSTLSAGSWRSARATPNTTTTASYPVSGSLLTWKIVAIALKPMY